MLPFAAMNSYYTNSQQRQVSRIIPDLIRSRELLIDLVWKDLRVRYRYAAIGFLWAILEPLLMTVILTFVFTMVFKLELPGEGLGSDATFILCGLITWQFFLHSLSSGTRSLVDSRDLIKKVDFPREVIPLASIGVNLVNFFIGFVILFAFNAFINGQMGIHALWIPVLVGIQLTLLIGLSLLFSSLNAYYRDISYMVDVGLLFGFYATPVFYQSETALSFLRDMHPWLPKLYMLNPMVGLVASYRRALFDNMAPDMSMLAWPVAMALGSICLGALVFRRRAGLLADHL